MNITKAKIEKLPTPETGQKIYRDEVLKGFGIRISSGGTKTFFVEKRIEGRVKRISIDKYPVLTVEEARIEAKVLLGKIAKGENPIAEKRDDESHKIDLRQVFNDYLVARKDLKETTINDYEKVKNWGLKDWMDKPIVDITKTMVMRKHSKLGESSEARANLAMRLVRALFNFAAANYENGYGKPLITENPVKRLSDTRAWFRVERRNTVVKAHQLPKWFEGVNSLANVDHNTRLDRADMGRTVRDYLVLLLLTGLRREEAASLTWDNVDLKSKTLTVQDTKNRTDHTLPLSDYLLKLLAQRYEGSKISGYVFPGYGPKGHIIFVGKHKDKAIKAAGFKFTLHDLRRTFITIAESIDIPFYAVRRLANHKMANDVTAGYIVTDVERLRKPMQKITDFILRSGKLKNNNNIMEIGKQKLS